MNTYTRGKGSRRVSPFTRRRLIGHPKAYTCNFTYAPGQGESVVVISTTYERALREAFEERKDPRQPISVEVIDPDFGRVFRAMGSGLSKVAGIGAKYAIRGGHIAKQAAIRAKPHLAKGVKIAGRGIKKGVVITAKGVAVTGKAAAEEVGLHYRSRELNKLIQDCYDANRVRRTRARYKLKRLYPDIYDVADFSKDRPHVPVIPVEVRVRAEKAKAPPKEEKPLPFPRTKAEAKAYVEKAKRLAEEEEKRKEKRRKKK